MQAMGIARREIALLAALWCGAAVLFYLVAGHTQGSYDTWRDLWFAAGIAEGLEFPAVGPGINRSFHLGPLWFYLLGVLALVVPLPQAAVALCAALVAAKFPLGYLFGRVLLDRWMGLFVVVLLAVPGWWIMELAVLTHTSAVAASLLLVLLAMVRARRRPGTWAWLALGTACALALHAHPTTLTVCAVALLRALLGTPGARQLRAALLLLLPLAVAVAPYVLSGGLLADAQAIAHYTGGLSPGPGALERVLLLAASTVLGGAAYSAWIWAGVDAGTALAWALAPWIVAGGLAIAGGVAMVQRRRRGPCLLPPGEAGAVAPDEGTRQRIALAFALGFLGQCLFLVLIRDITPPWMTFTLYPLLAIAVAAPASAALRASPRARWAAFAVLAVLAAGTSAAALRGVGSAQEWLWSPGYAPGSPGLMSVTEIPTGRVRVAVPPFTVRESVGLLPVHCARVQLHGALAPLADRTLGFPWRQHCGGAGNVVLGGAPRAGFEQHFAVWDAATLAHCGLVSGAGQRAKAFTDFAIHGIGAPIPLGDPALYPPRSVALAAESTTVTVAGATRPLLLVGNVLPLYLPFEVHSVWLDGAPVDAIASTTGYAVYACRTCSAQTPGSWRIALSAALPATDVVEFSCPRALRTTP